MGGALRRALVMYGVAESWVGGTERRRGSALYSRQF